MFGIRRFREWLRAREFEADLRSFAIGMNSTVDSANDLHVIFFDYDLDDRKRVEASVREAQDFWHLSHGFIYKTRHGFHVIMYMDHVPYERCRMIIDYARDVDPLFRYISRYYSHKTIRVAGKYQEKDIEFLDILPGARLPTKREREIGELKYNEHCALSGLSPIVDFKLFDVER